METAIYARNLHHQAHKQMEKLLFEMEEAERKLQTEVTDTLPRPTVSIEVSSHCWHRVVMDTLKDIRERESEI